MIELAGLLAPIVTPFTDDGGSLSEVRFIRMLRHLADQGLDGFVVGAECGEYASCSGTERKTMVEWTVRNSGGRTVIANVSSHSTMTSLDLAQHFARTGVRAVYAIPPSLGVYTDDEIAGYYESIARHGNTTVIVVDPNERINPGLEDRLAQTSTIALARTLANAGRSGLAFRGRRTYPDEFAISGAVVTPFAILDPEAATRSYRTGVPVESPLVVQAERHHLARLAKAALDRQGIEVGPPRSPLQPIRFSEFEALL